MSEQPRKAYPSDLTDEQWGILEPLLLAFENRLRPGPKREVDLREVINTLLSQNRRGRPCASLPPDWLPKSTLYAYSTKCRDQGLGPQIAPSLRPQVRQSPPLGRAQVKTRVTC